MADVFQSGAYDADGNRSLCIFHRRWNQGVTSAGRNEMCKERDCAAGSSEVCGYYTHWREKGKFRCAAHDYIYFIAYVGILIGSVVLVSLDNFDFETTFSAVLTTLGNVGPGMAQVGPMGNFAEFSPLSKLILCFDMLAGRLEIFPFLVLFTAPAWRRKF